MGNCGSVCDPVRQQDYQMTTEDYSVNHEEMQTYCTQGRRGSPTQGQSNEVDRKNKGGRSQAA